MARVTASAPVDRASTLTPYQVAIPDAALGDLRARLAHTRWPEPREINVAWMASHVAATEDLETFESLGV
jgi:hypothetical protein